MTRIALLPELDPATYRPNALHGDGRPWAETNCYADLWIELAHAFGFDPAAMLPFVLSVDFLGDQWTFFKPPHEDLRELYGFEIDELTVWRPLAEHVAEHLAAGRLVATEVDSFWLPDTLATDYRTSHTKTTIVIQDFDAERRRIGYFHNSGYFALEGDDYDQIFRPQEPAELPHYAELVRLDRLVRRPEAELRERSRALLLKHLARRPLDNPVARFADRYARDLDRLRGEGLERYHLWAFATTRQLGAAFELAAAYARWLAREELEAAAEAFERVSGAAKALILKGARAVNARREIDASALLGEMAEGWERGMTVLEARAGAVGARA